MRICCEQIQAFVSPTLASSRWTIVASTPLPVSPPSPQAAQWVPSKQRAPHLDGLHRVEQRCQQVGVRRIAQRCDLRHRRLPGQEGLLERLGHVGLGWRRGLASRL